jgi:hypothetical protein
VWRFAHDEADQSIHGEILFRPACQGKACEEAVIIDDIYFETHAKEERVLLFLRDHDHPKTLLNNDDFFSAFEMELLLGHYFFVKYENDLAQRFAQLHEPETYTECICGSSTVVTASAQAALEARAGGAKTVFLKLEGETPLYPTEVLVSHGVEVVEGLDIDAVKAAMEKADATKPETLQPADLSGILKKL